MKKKIIILIAIVVAVLALFGIIKALQIGSMMKKMEAMSAPKPVVVEVVKAKTAQWGAQVKSVGTLHAVQQIELAPQQSGLVEAIKFKSGDTVKVGQLLVQLSNSTLKAQLAGAQAKLELDKLNLARAEKLLKNHATSESNIDESRAEVAQDQASVDNFKAQLEQKQVRAPFDGVIGIRQVSLGQYIATGAAIATLQTTSPIFFDFTVPQTELSMVHKDQTLTLKTDAFSGTTFTGKISAIAPEVSIDNKATSVRGKLINPQKGKILRPGMFASVTLNAQAKKNTVIVPREAVNYTLYGELVWVVETDAKATTKAPVTAKAEKKSDKKADKKVAKAPKAKVASVVESVPHLVVKQRYVTAGQMRGDWVAVKGLKSGDTVVSSGAMALRQGQWVEITKKS